MPEPAAHAMTEPTPHDNLATTTTTADGAYDDGIIEPPPASRSFAVIACLVAALMFVTCVALLFFSWAGQEPATALIVVQGDDALRDATVALMHPTDRGGDEVYLTGQIKDGDANRLRFHVPAGTYRVVVTHDGRTLMDRQIPVFERGEIPLVTLHGGPTTRPSR